jgi:hypothetical protein
MKIKRKIDTKHILKAFVEEREIWMKDPRTRSEIGAMGTLFFRILQGQRVKNKKNGIDVNIPEWLTLD